MAAERHMNVNEARSRAIEASAHGDGGRAASVRLLRRSQLGDSDRAQKVDVPLEGLGIVLSIPMELLAEHAALERALRPNEVIQQFGPASRSSDFRAALLHEKPVINSSSLSFASDFDIQRDPTLEHLLRAGREAQKLNKDIGPIYADAVLLALVAKLLGDAERKGPPRGANAQKAPLPEWRLKRTLEYIDANYERAITLGDLSAAAGLSRMHFAAQFRRATGYRPREFVLRRRIEASQEMLLATRASLVEIALNVGFQTQSHFSTVFKRFTGETPNRWRGARLKATGA